MNVLGLSLQQFVAVDMTLCRFTSNGYHAAEALDMMMVYNSLPAADIQRSVLSFISVCCQMLIATESSFCLLALQIEANCSDVLIGTVGNRSKKW